MERGVDHHGVSARNNDSDGAFGSTILPFSTNSTELDTLPMVEDLFDECLALVNTIVSMIFIDGNSEIMSGPFE